MSTVDVFGLAGRSSRFYVCWIVMRREKFSTGPSGRCVISPKSTVIITNASTTSCELFSILDVGWPGSYSFWFYATLIIFV